MAGHFGTKHNRTPHCKSCDAPKYRAGLCRSHYFAKMKADGVGRKTPRPKKCHKCNTEFQTTRAFQKFCSYRCSQDDRNERTRKPPRPCRQLRLPAPRAAAKQIAAVCQNPACGKHFEKLRREYIKAKSFRQPKYCSHECAYAMRRGGESPKFRGGAITYRGAGWTQTAHEIRSRDGNLCGICQKLPVGKTKHHVDHIIPFRLMKQWGLEPNAHVNLLTLCINHHTKKTPLEDKLLRGDVLGFARGLVAMLYPIQAAQEAFAAAGLSAKGLVV
jgi:hypothetical protein